MALLFCPLEVNMEKSETTKTDITFTKEKKAMWSLLFKCWKKCFGKKTKSPVEL